MAGGCQSNSVNFLDIRGILRVASRRGAINYGPGYRALGHAEMLLPERLLPTQYTRLEFGRIIANYCYHYSHDRLHSTARSYPHRRIEVRNPFDDEVH